MNDEALEVACPTCGKAVRWTQQEKWRPFCSERCKLIDLGDWLTEEHRIPGEPGASTGNDQSLNDEYGDDQ